MATHAQSLWISPRKASEKLQVSEMKVYKWALLGRLRVLIEPGENVRLNAEDVNRLASERSLSVAAS